ncbi:MAG: flavodoxin domain-containing protein [bacterium]
MKALSIWIYSYRFILFSYDMKTLIIYYSLDGNTQSIAETLQQTLHADILRLHPIKDISGSKLMRYFRGGKQAVMKELPELAPLAKNPSDYDLIIIGTPVRAFTYAPALRTFFHQYPLTNKKIALFCTHEGQAKHTLTNMSDQLPNNEIIATKDFPDVAKHREASVDEAKHW